MSDAQRAGAAAAEGVEEVDAAGRVLRVVSRADIRAGHLRHRCTFVAVLDGDGSLVVHQRADWKDVWPSRWDVGFGGVVGVGEGWDEAAARELAEEAGVTAVLEPLGGSDLVTYDDRQVSEVGRVYLARHPGPFTFPDGEVVASDRVPLADLDAWLAGHDVVPDSLALVIPHLRGLEPGSGGGG